MNLGNLQQAVYTRLAGYTALTSQLSGHGVYARVPQPDEPEDASLFPYVTFAFPSGLPWDTDDIKGAELILRVSCWSRSTPITLSYVMDAVYNCLHEFALVISGANTVDCLFIGSSVMDDPDGVTIHGDVDFRITYDGI